MERNRQNALPLLLIVIAAVLLGARVASMLIKPNVTTGLVTWVSLDEAAQLAATSGKLILLDFTADWCAPCHQLDEEVFSRPELARLINEQFIPVRIVDRVQEDGRNPEMIDGLQRRYAVHGFPTVVFADAAGSERGRMDGYSSRADFERLLERVR